MRAAVCILLCAAALAGCQDQLYKDTVVSGYCEQYRRAILAPPDAGELQKLSRALKGRVVANETTYRCLCDKWQNPVCQNDPDKK